MISPFFFGGHLGVFSTKINTIFRYHKKMYYRLDFTGQSLVVYVGAVQPWGDEDLHVLT